MLNICTLPEASCLLAS